jgi:hypothetical protein
VEEASSLKVMNQTAGPVENERSFAGQHGIGYRFLHEGNDMSCRIGKSVVRRWYGGGISVEKSRLGRRFEQLFDEDGTIQAPRKGLRILLQNSWSSVLALIDMAKDELLGDARFLR